MSVFSHMQRLVDRVEFLKNSLITKNVMRLVRKSYQDIIQKTSKYRQLYQSQLQMNHDKKHQNFDGISRLLLLFAKEYLNKIISKKFVIHHKIPNRVNLN